MRTAHVPFNLLFLLVLGLLLAPFGSPPASAADKSKASAAESEKTPQPTPADDAKEKKSKKSKKKKPLKYFRVHLESRRDLQERTVFAKLTSDPSVSMPVEKIPILSESNLKRAALIEEPGGFVVQFQFDSVGAKLLESYSATSTGKHFAVAVDIDGETRWIATPLIRKRLPDGVLSFSPDASRADMDRLVRDLNKEIDRKRKQWLN